MELNVAEVRHAIPCICTNPQCGYAFPITNFIAGPVSATLTGCSTTCPRCQSLARILDGETTPTGQYRIREFIRDLRDLSQRESIETLSNSLQAANEEMTPEDLAEVFEEIDPRFSKYRGLIVSLSPAAFSVLVSLVATIVTLLTVLVMHRSNEIAEEGNELQREANLLQRESIELQRQTAGQATPAANEIPEIQQRLQDLENTLEQLYQENLEDRKARKPTLTPTTQPRKFTPVKGSLRNKPCPCGSRKKTKHCHPYWPYAGAVSSA